jgi:flagella basal body P-ring formation protein FlgA
MALLEIPLLLATLAQAIAPSQTLAADRIVDAVRQEVSVRLQDAGSSAQVHVSGRLQDQQLPAGKVRVEIGTVPGRWPRARASVPVRLWVDEQPVRSVAVWVEMRDERTVLTYAQDYPGHAQGADVQTVARVVDMVCCTGATVTQADDLKTRRVRHPVRAGQPVMQSDLELPPDVLVRQPVDVEVVRGGVHVIAKGTPLQDGRIGERIRVRTGESGQAIDAVVVAGQKVRVE